MTYDIVARLRDCTCVPHGEICRAAADEIERMRARVAKLENELRLEAAFQNDQVQREAL